MMYYSVMTQEYSEKEIPSSPNRSRTYDLPITSSDALPLSYRRLAGAEAIKLQAIAKRVDTLPVIGNILDAHHCIACPPPLPPYQCCTKFAMTFNQASINIELKGERGA